MKTAPGGGNLIVVDNSKDDEYHTQLNNRRVPYWSCGPTSAINALRAADYELPNTGSQQPEDALTEFLTSEAAYAIMDLQSPWYRANGYEPYMVHAVLAWGINEFMGRDVDTFQTTWHVKDLMQIILDGGALIMSGEFTTTGHMISVVGFEYTDKEIGLMLEHFSWRKVLKVIVDDPFGNWHTDYRSRAGNGIRFSRREFNNLTQEIGRKSAKWAHVIRRNKQHGT